MSFTEGKQFYVLYNFQFSAWMKYGSNIIDSQLNYKERSEGIGKLKEIAVVK